MILVIAARKLSPHMHGYLVAKAVPTMDDVVGLLAALSTFCSWARQMRLLPLSPVGASEL
jgi:hypothetical protein